MELINIYSPSEHELVTSKEETNMNDLAGLLALMQNNSNSDLATIMASAKDKGFGGDGIGLLVILLFFLMFNGGTFGNNANKAAAMEATGLANLNIVTSLYDRIAASQAATTSGFANATTELCSGFAETIGAVRNQGDRTYDATMSVAQQVQACCCQMEAKLASIQCGITGVARDVNDARLAINQSIALSEERVTNKIELGNERLACLIKDTAKDQELARLTRENCKLENQITQANMINFATNNTATAVSNLETFFTKHYTPTAK